MGAISRAALKGTVWRSNWEKRASIASLPSRIRDTISGDPEGRMRITSPSTRPTRGAPSKFIVPIRMALTVRQHRDGADLDEIFGRHHLGHFHHGGGRDRRLEILGADLVDGREVLDVADIDVDADDVLE